MLKLLIALTVMGAGNTLTLAGSLLAQTGPDVAPYISGGGATLMAGALVWISKKFVNGEVVVFKVADITTKLEGATTKYMELTEKTLDTNNRIISLVEQAHEREDSLRILILGRK